MLRGAAWSATARRTPAGNLSRRCHFAPYEPTGGGTEHRDWQARLGMQRRGNVPEKDCAELLRFYAWGYLSESELHVRLAHLAQTARWADEPPPRPRPVRMRSE